MDRHEYSQISVWLWVSKSLRLLICLIFIDEGVRVGLGGGDVSRKEGSSALNILKAKEKEVIATVLSPCLFNEVVRLGNDS